MDRKHALVAAALALVAGAATAQSVTFTPTGPVAFTKLFDPDGGVFAPGQFSSGMEGSFMANTNGAFTLTYLGQESAFSDGIHVATMGTRLTELNHVGDSITEALHAGMALQFTFFGSDGTAVTNGVAQATMHPSFALLGTNVQTNHGTFQYVLGYNDSANHDDWDDFVVGLNVAPVPEPQTYALLLAGLGVVGFVARRRQAR